MSERVLFEVQMFLHKVLNRVLNPLGLYVCWLSYFEALEEGASPLTTMPAGHECLYKVQLDALRVLVGLMELDKKAEAIGYTLIWVEGESFFVLVANSDRREFPWTQDGLSEAREIILHDSTAIVEREALG